MTAPIRVGLLGAGRIGSLHARLIAQDVPGLGLGGVFDVDEEAAESVARSLGVPTSASADELMTSPATDAIAICTSTDTHVDLVVQAAAIGKPVLLEKPVSLDLGEVDRALDAARRAGLFLQVGFNRRFDPAHASVRDAIAGGEV